MRLPPLNALRAFEAAARHEGFIAAAEELHVTRGAISRQVKLLETYLGVELFRRQAQGVQLTSAGRRFLPVLSECFGRIARDAAQLVSDASELHVLCPPATSIRWLIPRLASFQQAHPDIRVRLTTDFHGTTGVELDYDIGFSVADWPDRSHALEVLPLFPVMLTPACAPAYLQKAGPFDRPADLARAILLHETPRRADWTAWAAAFAPGAIDPDRGHDFPNLDLAVKAAVMGTGLVMADLALCREELESGMLITPFAGLTCPSPYGSICVLGARDRWDMPKVKAFRDWAYAEAATERRLLSG